MKSPKSWMILCVDKCLASSLSQSWIRYFNRNTYLIESTYISMLQICDRSTYLIESTYMYILLICDCSHRYVFLRLTKGGEEGAEDRDSKVKAKWEGKAYKDSAFTVDALSTWGESCWMKALIEGSSAW